MQQLFITNEAQRYWLDKIDSFQDELKQAAQQEDESGEFCGSTIELLRKIGFPKLTLPKEDGGEGLNAYDVSIILERLASYNAGAALTISWTLMVVGDLYKARQWPEEKLAALAIAIQQGAILNRALSEIATGSPIRGGRPSTSAVRVNNKWILNGRKSYTTGAYALDYFLVSTWVEELESIVFFLVSKHLPGVRVEENWDVISMRATGSHDVVFEDVELALSDLVEIPKQMKKVAPQGWGLFIPAVYLGIAKAARDYAVEFSVNHAPTSIQGTISDLPNVQSAIGEIDLQLAQMRFVLYGVANAFTDESKVATITHEAGIAKHTVVNGAIAIIDKAMRVVGARSLQQTNPLQRHYRDIRAGLHNPPMDDITIANLAKQAIDEMKLKGAKEYEIQKV